MKKLPETSVFNLKSAKKTIWIFGAGASAGAPYKVPVQRELIKHFLTMTIPGPANFQNNFNTLQNDIRKILERVQPGCEAGKAILEEIFSAYELEANSEYSTIEEAQSALTAIEKLRKALRYATQVYGSGRAAKWNPHKRNNINAPYAELLEVLFPVGCALGRLKNHVLATMNYDINIDRCIINMLNADQGDLYIDYGIEFADFRLKNSFKRPEERSVLLLRLHGSLNWIRCQSCQAMFTTIDRHANVVKTEKCKMCKHKRLDQVLIHPSFNRSYTDPILKIVWGRLQEELINSDRWVFIGYSFPTADVHLRELLRHSLRVRKDQRQKRRLFGLGGVRHPMTRHGMKQQ